MSRGDDTPRSTEERERARLEREARRAAQRGDPPPPIPPALEEPPPEPPPVATPPAARARVAAAAQVAERPRAAVAVPPPPPPPADPGERATGNGQRGTFFRVAIAAALLVALFAVWFLFSLFQPFKGDGEGAVRVQIPTGATVTEIGDILEENDVISSAFFFRTRVTLGGDRGDLKPGSY